MAIEKGCYIVKNYDFYKDKILSKVKVENIDEIHVYEVQNDTVLIQEIDVQGGIGILHEKDKQEFRKMTDTKFLHKK